MDSEIMALVKRVRSNMAQWRRSLEDSEQTLEQLFMLLRERAAEAVHLRARLDRLREQYEEQSAEAYPAEEVITAKIKVEPEEGENNGVPVVEGVLSEDRQQAPPPHAHVI